MFRNSSKHFICEFDLKLSLEEFFLKRSNIQRKFINHLNEDQHICKLLDAAIDNRILKNDIRSKVVKSNNNALTLIYELNKKCCTVELLCECMRGYELQELFGILGVYEKMFVVKPVETCVPTKLGKELTLSFLVEGYPYPTFKWFHNGSPLPDATEPSLILLNFRKEMEGKYYCIAEQRTPSARLTTLVSDPIECFLHVNQAELEVDLPPEVVCSEAEDVTLKVKADEDFSGTYEWFLWNRCVYKSDTNYLVIKNASPNYAGPYKCVLRNAAGETHSNICNLKIQPSPLRPSVKLALLIGNSEYLNCSPLKTPCEDVKLLSICLREIGFTVFSYTNITGEKTNEILSKFFSVIPEESFVFLFFSGHGFELCNNKFFIPADCPPNGIYTLENCLSHQFIIKKVMDTKPFLLISVLDMCLKGPDKTSNPQLYNENLEHHGYDEPTRLSFYEACATSDYQIAYEQASQQYGLYCKCLCKYIMKDLKIIDVFTKAHKDFVDKDHGHQSPQLKFVNANYDFRLKMTPRGKITCSDICES